MAKLQGTATHCKRGHERNEANTNNAGKCKPCMALAVADWRAKQGGSYKPQEVGIGGKRGTATHCKRGHERAVYGVERGNGKKCSECSRLITKAWHEANPKTKATPKPITPQEVQDLKSEIAELKKALAKATKPKQVLPLPTKGKQLATLQALSEAKEKVTELRAEIRKLSTECNNASHLKRRGKK
jgi:hypothetical protein